MSDPAVEAAAAAIRGLPKPAGVEEMAAAAVVATLRWAAAQRLLPMDLEAAAEAVEGGWDGPG